MTSATRVEAALAIAPDHPAFAGHFPGRPIVPAVVLLAEALASIESATLRPAHEWVLSNAKFLRPAGPGAQLTLMHEASNDGRRFEIRSGGELIASGTLAPAGNPP
jgi:3-hydroxyacyl-[acyl-carrier-protein] dehydratase